MTESSRCCANGCKDAASIRQPLELGPDLALHVPLCKTHNEAWLAFHRQMVQRGAKRSKDAKLALIAFDMALASAAFPPEHHG